MECNEVLNKISPYLDGETDPALSEEISRHLALCSACRAELARFGAVDGAVKRIPRFQLPPEFAAGVVATACKSAVREPKPALAARVFAPIVNIFQNFIRLLGLETPGGNHALDEFDDVPSCFIGYAYFRILN